MPIVDNERPVFHNIIEETGQPLEETALSCQLALRNHFPGSQSVLESSTLWRLFFTMALTLTGTCTCKRLQYTVKLDSADSARTSLCHCSSCKKAFGTNYGLTSKVRIRLPLGHVATGTHSRLTVLPEPRSQLRASNTAKESQSCTSRRMAWSGSSVAIAAHSRVNTGYGSLSSLLSQLPMPRNID